MGEDHTAGRAFGPDAWDPLARGLMAYHRGDHEATLVVHADDGEAETMPISVFFRSIPGELRDVDREALIRTKGRTLDVGAGTGSLTLLLQEEGLDVTALEVIPQAVEIMRERGVEKILAGRLEDQAEGRAFETILLLMNGTALAGTLAGLPGLLNTLAGLLAPGGQLLLDSTDLLGEWEGEGGAPDEPGATDWGEGEYPGELQYQMEFQGARGAPFPQLFVDPRTLTRVAEELDWHIDVVWDGEGGEYLAVLTREN